MDFEYLKSLYDDVVRMVQPIVVKRSDIAQANETLETLKAYQLYEACLVGDTNIFNFEITPQILARYIDRSQVKRTLMIWQIFRQT